MQPTYLSLVKIFGGETRLSVPLFQRPYVWTKEEQWEPLWQDLADLADRVLASPRDKPIAGHFLGTVVLEQVTNRSGTIARREIIDGQQRLTTLQVLLQAAQHALADVGSGRVDGPGGPTREPGATKASLVAARQLAALTANPADDDERYKVWPTNEDRVAFREVMDASGPEDVTGAATRLSEAYRFFFESMRTWLGHEPSPERVSALAASLKDHVRLIVLDLDINDEPQAIFETLNAHGTPLLPADLIKNWLLWEANRQDKNLERLYATGWQDFDKDHRYWRTEVGTGHAARARIDTFLQGWLTSRTLEATPIKHLYAGFLRFAAPPKGVEQSPSRCDVEAIMSDIRASADTFRTIVGPTGHTRFDAFLRRLALMEVVVFHPVLLALMRRQGSGSSDLDATAVALESYLVRRMICNKQTRGYGGLATDVLKDVASINVGSPAAPGIEGFLSGQAPDGELTWPGDDEFRRAWCGRRFYGALRRSRVLMLLQAIEEHYQRGDAYSEPVVSLDFSRLQVEHVMPQKWEKHWPLPPKAEAVRKLRLDPEGMSPGQRSSLERAVADRELRVDRIGNLTLVSEKLNPKLSNAAWIDSEHPQRGKREALERHARLQMTARLLKANPDVWTERAIDKRSEELFDAARVIWPPPVGRERTSE